MSDNYKYKDLPFTKEIAQAYLDIQFGKTLNIAKVGERLLKLHLDQGIATRRK